MQTDNATETALTVTACSFIRRRVSRAIVLLTVLFFSEGAAADLPDAYPFNRGGSRITLQVGSTTAFGQDYTALGLGAGYYVRDGLELGLDFDAWLGNSPGIYRISPGLRAVLYSIGPVKPYVGVFFRRTLVEDAGDRNEAGGRAGVTVMTGMRSNFSFGVVYDRRLDCEESFDANCSDLYTELAFAVLF